jgi:hypothetical protein
MLDAFDSAQDFRFAPVFDFRFDFRVLKGDASRPSSAVPKGTPCGGCLAAKTGRDA